MKILHINILRGPNQWSIRHHRIIDMKLDIEELENFPTNKIKGFYERLTNLIPSLYEHYCSEGHEGGFFERVKDGTMIGHVVEHIAIEIQELAGMSNSFGRTRIYDDKSIYSVVFNYEIESAGIYAANAAVKIADALIKNTYYDVQADIQELKKIKQIKGLGPSTAAIINEAIKRGIPYRRLNDSSLVLFGQGIYKKKITASLTSATSYLGVETAGDKEATKKTLQKASIPTPAGRVVTNVESMKEAIDFVGYPLVLKPINGNHGRGITTNVKSYTEALKAFYTAQTISKEVIVEKFISGSDYRFLVINYKLAAVAKRLPAMVVGDGVSSIKKLIQAVNSDPNRGAGHEKNLTAIKIDDTTQKILDANKLTQESVLPSGQVLFLKDTANISTGGTSTDVTHLVHPANVFMAERIAALLDLDICGIDVISSGIENPVTEKNGAVLEVNASPGLRMHLNPANGMPRNVAKPIVDILYPDNSPSRIPIIAITGTNGKTTTTRLVAHMAMTAGHLAGYTTSDGIYIQNYLIQYGDCTGPLSAEIILSDPTVDFAVLECARGGILRSGLGFDHCNISIVTNVTEDHLGLNGINTLEDLAFVKVVVPESTFEDGTAILNADDDLVYKMAEGLKCNIALFSMDAANPRIITHCKAGGLVIYPENDFIVLQKGEWKQRVEHLNNIPVTFSGRAESMIKNVLPATLAAFIQNFRLEDIVKALQTFVPSPSQTPGRLNVFSFKKFDVMIDYAHNAGGFIELKKFLDKINATSKIGIITAVGDRRDQDIRDVGYHAAQIFDIIIIRHDADLRGRTKENITALLMEGIYSADESTPVNVISDELEAIQYAMEKCDQGAFITVCTDAIKTTTDFLIAEKHREEENASLYEYNFIEIL